MFTDSPRNGALISTTLSIKMHDSDDSETSGQYSYAIEEEVILDEKICLRSSTVCSTGICHKYPCDILKLMYTISLNFSMNLGTILKCHLSSLN